MFPPSVQRWQERGEYLDLGGDRIFALSTDGAARPVLVLHGFPTSSHDFHRVLPLLGDRPIHLFDMLGYGLSDKPADHSYSLFEQADLAAMLAHHRGLDEVDLVAHDMGTSVACELLARRERGLLGFRIRSVLLMNGSVHIEMAHLTPSQRLLRSPLADVFARVGSYRIFRMQLGRILGRELPEEDLSAMWAQLTHLDGKRRLPRIIEYIDERRRFAHRWVGALTRLDIPAHVLWGPLDTVAVLAIAQRLASEIPKASLEILDGLGHYPQLEDPERTASAIAGFLESV